MKVVFVLPSMAVGGVERVRLTLLEQFVADGIECRLALRRCRGELLDRAQALVPVEELAPRGLHQFVPALTRLIRRERPTHVITAFPDVAALTWLALRASGSRATWVHSVHHTHAVAGFRTGFRGRIRSRLENRMAGFAYRRADAVVAVSNGLRDEIVGGYGLDPARVVTLYNPVVPDGQLVPASRPALPRSEPCRIVAVGRLVRAKGFDLLVRAMAKVEPGFARLDIWGEGPERGLLQRCIDELGLARSVRLRGYTADPFAVMRGADVFVSSSRHDALPGALIEALASGLRIVATDCPGGSREILENGKSGALVPAEDVDALAAAITRAVRCDVVVDAGSQLARARDFSRSVCCARWESLLASLTV